MTAPLTHSEIQLLLESDEQFMELLRIVDQTVPQPWCIFGGQLRNIIWDNLSDNPEIHTSSDVDIGIFVPDDTSLEKSLGEELKSKNPNFEWDIENFAFSHIENQDDAYTNLEDGLTKQLMTVMSVGASLDNTGNLTLITPLGIEDLARCIVRPTPVVFRHPERTQLIEEKITKKKWQQKWPELQIIL